MKQNIKSVPINTSPSPIKVKKANVKIILEDKQGNKEVIADHNMTTNALQNYFENCGWLNRDNAPQSSLAQEMLGGIMLFDDEIDEDADITHVPSGLHMIANGAIGTTNSGAPYELGSCSDVSTETGWQADGTFLQTYRWDENHGNGTIASLALTQKLMGYIGIGNPSGEAASGSTRPDMTYYGSQTPYALGVISYGDGGYSCFSARVSIKGSSAYRIDLRDVANRNITINKYRIPTQKINLKGQQYYPVVLDTQTITIGNTASDDVLRSILMSIGNVSGGSESHRYNYYDAYDHYWVWNNATGSGQVWGTDYTQYLWDIDVVNGTYHTYTIPAPTGYTLHGIYQPKFVGNTIAFVDGYFSNAYSRGSDASRVFQFDITSGTVGEITSFANTNGWGNLDGPSVNYQWGGDKDKVYVATGNGRWTCYDKAGFLLPTNLYVSGQSVYRYHRTDCPQILYNNIHQSGGNTTYAGIVIYRSIDYIGTIYNLPTPVTKDATKTMTVVYTLTFDEEPTP